MKPLTLLLALASVVLSLGIRAQESPFTHDLTSEKKPWTDKAFFNDPDNFQFVVISDRTGGHRPGVFGKALEKINRLHPEFVMSVGDLIEGYTTNTEVLNAEWAEFHGILDSLDTKFFYVAGNHDYTNPVMAKMWKDKIGPDYYHFIYKDVLFLIANSSNGEGSVVMKDEQIAYLKKAIADHPDVRWTLLFLHHPMWSYGDMNGYNQVEEALQGRDYTVFAGHTHRYMFQVRNDQNHYLLATSGGGSSLRGPKFGEFDHVSWVTMTDEGPKMVNLALSGILDDDISTPESRQQARELIDAAELQPLVLSKEDQRKVVLKLKNTSDRLLHFKAQLFHHHQVMPDSSQFRIDLEPGDSQTLVIRTQPVGQGQAPWDPLQLNWEMGYDTGFMEPDFSLSGTELIELNPTLGPPVDVTEQDVFLKDMFVKAGHIFDGDIALRYTADGSSPTPQSPVFPDSLQLSATTELNMVLYDSEGFRSRPIRKAFDRVKPIRSVRVRNPKKGLAFTYYEGEFKQVPDFASLGTPKSKGIAENLNPASIGQREDHYAIQFTGYVEIPEDGVYKFDLRSDDGSNFYIGDQLIIDNDGSHQSRTRSGYVALKKGWHPVRIDYFEDYMGQRLYLWYYVDGERIWPEFRH